MADHDCAPVVASVRACTAYPPCPRTYVCTGRSLTRCRRAECAGVGLPRFASDVVPSQPASQPASLPAAADTSFATIAAQMREGARVPPSRSSTLEKLAACSKCAVAGLSIQPPVRKRRMSQSLPLCSATVLSDLCSPYLIQRHSQRRCGILRPRWEQKEMGSCTPYCEGCRPTRLDAGPEATRHEGEGSVESTLCCTHYSTDILHDGSSSIVKAGMDIEEHRYRQGPGHLEERKTR